MALALTDRLADGEPCRLCGDMPLRMARVRALSRQGLTTTEIARQMHTSRRTVYRLKAWLKTKGATLWEANV